MKTPAFTCALYREEHLPGILSLWEHHSGWGKVSEEEFRKWMNGPYGDWIIIVILDENDTVQGQMILTPTEIYVHNQARRAVRLSAPIINNSLWETSLLSPQHPINQGFLFVRNYIQENDYDILYVNPLSSWVRIIRLAHFYGFPKFTIKQFTYYSISTETKHYLHKNYTVKFFANFTEEHEKLWKASMENHGTGCTIVRTEKWLTYKAGDYDKIAVYENDKLIGFSTFNPVRHLLYDFVAASKEVANSVIQVSLDFLLKSERGSQYPNITFVGTLHFLEACVTEETLKLSDSYTFAYACFNKALGKSMPPIEEWELTSLD